MTDRVPIPVAGGSFAIAANGYADGPAQPLETYLLARGAARVFTIAHPLVPEGPTEHRVRDVHEGRTVERSRNLRLRPPASFALDPFVPLRVPEVDVWFGFNCLASARGIAQRTAHRARRVVHWNVDFVPERFGPGMLTRVYEGIDKWCCRHADARVDLSRAALEGRAAHYSLDPALDHGVVIPMGMWLQRTEKAGPQNHAARRVVFLGHLVERMGVPIVVDAIDRLVRDGVDVQADIIGGGPLLDETRASVQRLGLASRITVHGFVPDYRDIEHLLARATVAVAPYVRDPSSFTRFADPGKLKAYLGASLPIVLTDVPPNADELVALAGAEIVTDRADAVAAAVRRLLADEAEWLRRRQLAAGYAARFDWNQVFDDGLTSVGLDVAVTPAGSPHAG